MLNIQSLWMKTVLAGCFSVGLYCFLAVNSQSYGQASLLQMLVVCFSCAVICFWLRYQYEKEGKQISFVLLIAFAVLYRLIGITAFPVLEDDIYRYLWDARMTIEYGSAYNVPPSNFFSDIALNDQFENILDLINYPDIATVYGPTLQWLFALSYLIAPGEIWPLQLILSVTDIVIIFVLLRLTKPNNVLLYAWCPLVIKEFAFSAHPDVLGAMFIVLAILMLRYKAFIFIGILLALAVGAKVFALVLVPFFLRFHLSAWLAFIATAIIIALPFGLIDAWFPEGLKAMGESWLFNAPLYELLLNWFAIDAIKIFLIGGFALGVSAYLLIYWFKQSNSMNKTKQSGAVFNKNDGVVRGDLVFASLLLVIPVFNPWYMVWLLPFAVLRPSYWAWVASVTVLLSYASGINLINDNLAAYQIPYWILILEFFPIIIAYVFFDKRIDRQ